MFNTTCKLCPAIKNSEPRFTEPKTTTTIPQISPNGIEFLPVQAGNVHKYDILLYSDRICTVISSEKYENKYSGKVPKHHIVLSTLREGKILETVMRPNEIMMRITANGMAMMPEQLPREPVLAVQAKKDMVIMIRGRACQIRNVTLTKIEETTLVCIQAQTLCGTRWEDMTLAANVPLEFPGQRNAIAAVQKALSESQDKFLTGSCKIESADTPLEGQKVKVEVSHKEVVEKKQAPSENGYRFQERQANGCLC
ncbi:hypothetical protein BLS_003297 [Venturia inaequalis]|uniref:Uncharacterized protein n=1 Tax=Venturia inaequalis TaxID=5025 RepID=A0A8H3UNW1_VENIN|nr:hypothetical protein BLS_003297 [Venturia inaequalis]